MIRFENFSYRYAENHREALRDVNLEIGRGELVLLTGPSGCGKTTLFMALAGFLFSRFEGQVSGTVEIAGLDPTREPIYTIADAVGLVQQNPEDQFCTLMVEDEIAFGLENRLLPREEIESRLAWSLDAVGAAHLRGRELASLSGGEKQKIALAAILAAGPRVILFDEPTSNLDICSTQEIFDVILNLRRQTDLTLLVVEHKLDFLQSAGPRLITMESGRITAPSDQKPAADIQPPTFSGSREEPLLEARNVSAGYDTPVLSGINLDLYPGELVSLLGDNGSGKSTLLLSLVGLVPRLAGTVRFQGRDTADFGHGLFRDIGLVFQNPDHQLFATTVWKEAVLGAENFGLPPGYEDSIRSLLEQAGLGDRLECHPYQLSFGEKRRLNLISVLGYRPRILFLDEIYIGQDRRSTLFLHSLLCSYVEEGNCVVLVNHNPAYYAYASTRLVFLRDGCIAVDSPLIEARVALQELGENAWSGGAS